MSYYHERLKQRSTSASRLEEQKRRMSQGPTIEELERRLQEAEQSFTDAAGYLGVPAEEIPVDDGAPPSPPYGVIVSPFFHQLDVTWAEPPAEDRVIRTFVRVGPKSGGAAARTTLEATMFGAALADLPVEPHTVEVFFEDRWGRQSDWSAVVEATPTLTAAESIDLTKAEIAGSLGWENLDPLNDPANLGNDVVTARAMATQNLAATRAWIGDAAIETAMIRNLSVDKLTAGMFTAGQIVLAGGGSLKAGGTLLDSGGLSAGGVTVTGNGLRAGRTLLDGGGLTLNYTPGNWGPGRYRDYKVSGPDDNVALAFFLDTTLNPTYQGAQIRADGSGGRGAQINLQAKANNGPMCSIEMASAPPNNTIVNIIPSGNGRVQIWSDLYVQGKVYQV